MALVVRDAITYTDGSGLYFIDFLAGLSSFRFLGAFGPRTYSAARIIIRERACWCRLGGGISLLVEMPLPFTCTHPLWCGSRACTAITVM